MHAESSSPHGRSHWPLSVLRANDYVAQGSCSATRSQLPTHGSSTLVPARDSTHFACWQPFRSACQCSTHPTSPRGETSQSGQLRSVSWCAACCSYHHSPTQNGGLSPAEQKIHAIAHPHSPLRYLDSCRGILANFHHAAKRSRRPSAQSCRSSGSFDSLDENCRHASEPIDHPVCQRTDHAKSTQHSHHRTPTSP